MLQAPSDTTAKITYSAQRHNENKSSQFGGFSIKDKGSKDYFLRKSTKLQELKGDTLPSVSPLPASPIETKYHVVDLKNGIKIEMHDSAPKASINLFGQSQEKPVDPTAPPKPPSIKYIGDIQLGKTIGSGSTGKVKLGKNIKTGELVTFFTDFSFFC